MMAAQIGRLHNRNRDVAHGSQQKRRVGAINEMTQTANITWNSIKQDLYPLVEAYMKVLNIFDRFLDSRPTNRHRILEFEIDKGKTSAWWYVYARIDFLAILSDWGTEPDTGISYHQLWDDLQAVGMVPPHISKIKISRYEVPGRPGRKEVISNLGVQHFEWAKNNWADSPDQKFAPDKITANPSSFGDGFPQMFHPLDPYFNAIYMNNGMTDWNLLEVENKPSGLTGDDQPTNYDTYTKNVTLLNTVTQKMHNRISIPPRRIAQLFARATLFVASTHETSLREQLALANAGLFLTAETEAIQTAIDDGYGG